MTTKNMTSSVSSSLSSSHQQLVTVATCNLNQWALDFDGNALRILDSCRQAKAAGASYRLGPELELPGYGCEDHFLESDTFEHCWQSMAWLLEQGATDGILCDFGMPVLFGGTRYNCRILALDKKILLIRPKVAMADSGNYRESRYFTAYQQSARGGSGAAEETLVLPRIFLEKFQQATAPFGLQYLRFGDGATVGCESCEELWTPRATHVDLALSGVELIGNGSGSYHELRKLHQRLELVVAATRKCGGVYLYSNQRGCDGGRLYYDGGALIACNGQVLAQANQFCVDDVQVITATIDLDDVRSYRASIPSFGIQAAATLGMKQSFVDVPDKHLLMLSKSNSTTINTRMLVPTSPLCDSLRTHSPQEECCLGPACWLWDYLRRSGATGFFLPLSGGADSSSVATIVYAMCTMVTEAAQNDPAGLVAQDVRRICQLEENENEANEPWVPATPQELANHVLHTTYMGTENSSEKTTSRAKRLAEALGSYHLSIQIDLMVSAVVQVFSVTTGRTPRFSVHGGTLAEDLSLQNIQARLRMVTAYLFAQLLPWVRQKKGGFLLVLGSANVDEGLRGYMTKYDCSSADLNPIGAISKGDLKKMLLWASDRYDIDVLKEIAGAPPTAELRPIVVTATSGGGDGDDEETQANNDAAEHSQLDEEEMGMSYYELGLFGTLRKISRCGPVSMFRKLCVTWNHLEPSVVAEKVKRFFYYYSVNRHKMCTITPAYHAEAYSPDDNRFDLRPFLYNVKWPRQFSVIDALVAETTTEATAAQSKKDE